jgi:hypothetical protein
MSQQRGNLYRSNPSHVKLFQYAALFFSKAVSDSRSDERNSPLTVLEKVGSPPV